jgi:hypothetical protein
MKNVLGKNPQVIVLQIDRSCDAQIPPPFDLT